MNKWLKALALLCVFLVIGFVVFIVSIINILPSPAQIGQKMGASQTRAKPKGETTTQNSNISINSDMSPNTAPQNSTAAAQIDDNGNMNLKNEQNQKILADLLNPDHAISDVCDYLKNFDQSKIDGYEFNEFGKNFEQSSLGEIKDPVIQSFKPILRTMLQLPSMKNLIDMASQAAQQNDHSFFTKAQFYKLAYNSYADLKQNKARIENVSDKTYFLYMMTKAVSARPQLSMDSNTLEYCKSIENAINENSSFSIEDQKREFETFLNYAHLQPNDIGYDPNYRTHMAIDFDSLNLRMHGGWIDGLFKSKPPGQH